MAVLCKPTELKHLTENGTYYEYTKAADPIGSGIISPIPLAEFSSELHQTGGTRVIPLDVSERLGCQGPDRKSTRLNSSH